MMTRLFFNIFGYIWLLSLIIIPAYISLVDITSDKFTEKQKEYIDTLKTTILGYIPLLIVILLIVAYIFEIKIDNLQEHFHVAWYITITFFIFLAVIYPILFAGFIFNDDFTKFEKNEPISFFSKPLKILYWYAKFIVFTSNKVFSFVIYPIYHKIRFKNFRIFEKHTKTEPMETPINRPSEPAQETQKPNAQAVQSILDKLDKF